MHQPRFRARSGRYPDPGRATMTAATADDRLVAARRALGPWVGLTALPALLVALAYTFGWASSSWVAVTTAVWLTFAAAFAVLDVLAGRHQARTRVLPPQ